MISHCGLYRYSLTMTWDVARPVYCWLMLNPSTADHTKDDPTIRRCLDFTERWGGGGLVVVNLFALRSTDPKRVWGRGEAAVGPDNDRMIGLEAADRPVVAAWGADKRAWPRGKAVLAMIEQYAKSIECIGRSAEGYPRHPLYVPGETKRERYP